MKRPGEHGFRFAFFVGFLALSATALSGAAHASSRPPTPRPRAADASTGEPGDHWHAYLGVDICGEWLPAAPAFEKAAAHPKGLNVGIHSHGDGLIHVHPFTRSEEGAHATLGKFLHYGAWGATPRSIAVWTGPKSASSTRRWRAGDACGAGEYRGQTGRVILTVDGEVRPGNPSKVRLRDGQIIVLAFLPAGTVPPEPPDARRALAYINDTGGATGKPTYGAPPPLSIDQSKNYTATLETSLGTITIDLVAQTAPVAVNNFVFLADQHFYDGLTFHRVSKDFVIQGGDPTGDGTGGPGYTVVGEVPSSAASPAYPIGTVAMAKSQTERPGTSGSQFFIVTGSAGSTIPPDYAVVGKVASGLAVAQQIAALYPRSLDGPPTTPVYIRAMTITTS